MSVRVSVVIATYNTGQEIEHTAASVRRQSLGLDAVDLILVDDGSTDGDTRARLQTLAREPWVTVREIPNSGWPCPPPQRRSGPGEGDYVFFMDHDGRLYPEALERMVIAGDRDPVVSVVADYPCYRWIIHDTNSSIRHPDPSQYFAAAGEVLDLVDSWPYGARGGRLPAVGARHGPRSVRPWRRAHLAGGVPTTRISEVRVRDRSLHLTTSVRHEGADGPVLFDQADDGRVRPRPAGPLPAHVAGSALDVTEEVSMAAVEVLLNHRSTNADWLVPTQFTASFSPGSDGVSWQAGPRPSSIPATALLGGPITPGVWDVKLRTTAFGYDSRVALRVPPEQVLPALPGAASHVVPYRTRNGRLALRVGKPAPAPQRRTLRARIRLRTRLRNLLGA